MLRLALFLVIQTVVFSHSAVFAADNSSFRINRPDSSGSITASSERSIAANVRSETKACCSKATAGQGHAEQCCSTGKYSCNYFRVDATKPLKRFEKWLQLSLHPPLCHTVLCQRQCAYSSYEPCNALGQERHLLDSVYKSSQGCDGDSCCGTASSQ